ncbi:MAG: alanine dehydrogenase [Anaerolineae bacterium]|jgi:alanine dehydrogenase|nr:alanine dehydrogenase [Anaerolineae bacterium]MBT7069290.1 alanine dehydrogenase [Anaerolineae bacterium]MBT7325994.1 alanine dehydrogenase [Anaerolineae bacterium]
MSIPKTIGFPSMREEAGEKRVFLPEFIRWLADFGVEIYLEEGYGVPLGYSLEDYQAEGKAIFAGTREQAFGQDIVILLRSPKPDEFALMRKGGVLISMLHYHTRPRRVQLLRELGINAISLDSIVDGNGIRLVQNMRAVAWNGLDAAFGVLEKKWPDLRKDNGEPFRVLVMGTGMVGKHAFEAATKLGDRVRNDVHIAAGGAGVIAKGFGRNITRNPEQMKSLFEKADILVDTTQRRNPSTPVVPNEWLAWLPDHAVIVDLSVDPYTLNVDPPVVRGIEGIPQGNLDQYIFAPDDPNWMAKIPPEIPTDVRRTSISCYSWPGIRPQACMQHYQGQLKPLMQVLLKSGYARLAHETNHFGRALYRGSLDAFLNVR